MKEKHFNISNNNSFNGLYNLVRMVGRGRYSIVYQARHLAASTQEAQVNGTNLNGDFAIKIVSASAKDRDRAVHAMRLEAMAALATNHPNVIKVYDYITSTEPIYITMELAHCGDVRTWLRGRAKPLGVLKTLTLIRQALNGLEHLHSLGIIHRDIKPENLLITKSEQLKITDFGTALIPFLNFPENDMVRGIGTFDYLAPEVFQGHGVYEGSDIYSLGVTAYLMLTGKLPFVASSMFEQLQLKLNGQYIPLTEADPQMPESVQEMISCALQPEPLRRFQNTIEFRKMLDACLEEIRSGDNWSTGPQETQDLLAQCA